MISSAVKMTSSSKNSNTSVLHLKSSNASFAPFSPQSAIVSSSKCTGLPYILYLKSATFFVRIVFVLFSKISSHLIHLSLLFECRCSRSCVSRRWHCSHLYILAQSPIVYPEPPIICAYDASGGSVRDTTSPVKEIYISPTEQAIGGAGGRGRENKFRRSNILFQADRDSAECSKRCVAWISYFVSGITVLI